MIHLLERAAVIWKLPNEKHQRRWTIFSPLVLTVFGLIINILTIKSMNIKCAPNSLYIECDDRTYLGTVLIWQSMRLPRQPFPFLWPSQLGEDWPFVLQVLGSNSVCLIIPPLFARGSERSYNQPRRPFRSPVGDPTDKLGGGYCGPGPFYLMPLLICWRHHRPWLVPATCPHQQSRPFALGSEARPSV